MSEASKLRYHVKRREFLNENPEKIGYVIGVVQDTRYIPDDDVEGWKWGCIVLDLCECYRRVSFEFDLSDADERANSLRKINLIAEVVNSVREGIEKEVEARSNRPLVQDHSQGTVA